MFFTRKDNRLPIKNLYQGGHWYFVTLCVQDMQCIFVEETSSLHDVANKILFENKIKLNHIGEIVEQKLVSLPKYYRCIIDFYVIMPNHIHFIITSDNINISKMIAGLKSFTYREIKQYTLKNFQLP
jgi:REP element-mobilizing transposase RayT